MKNSKDMILVPRKFVARFLKDYVVANYAIQMFTHLVGSRKFEIHMDTDEICSVLKITRQQLEAAWRKGEIKSFRFGGLRFFSAFDVAKIAELIHRPKRFRKLMQISNNI